MNSWALVTGASTGLGKEFCELFAKDNINLVIVARNKEKLNELASSLKEIFKIQIEVCSYDLSIQDNVEEVVQYLTNKNIQIDYLVNNAGMGVYGNFAETPWKEEYQMMELNMVTLTHLMKKFIPLMVKNRKGKILNVASTAAFQPGPLMSVYFASKAFVLSLSEALNEELKNTGVTITTLCPGPTETDFFKSAKMDSLKFADSKSKLMMTSREVAEIGYKSLMSSERVVVAGILNKITAFSTRFLPRPLLAKIAQQLLH